MILKVEITDGVTLDIDDNSIECHSYLLNKCKINMTFFEIPIEIKNKILDFKKPGYIIRNPETNEIYRKGFLDNTINKLCKSHGLIEYKPLIFTHIKN